MKPVTLKAMQRAARKYTKAARECYASGGTEPHRAHISRAFECASLLVAFVAQPKPKRSKKGAGKP